MKKIAIVNRTNLKNYGSVLQSHALCLAARKLGFESEIVWESGNISSNFDFRPVKILKTGLKLLTHPSLLKGTIDTLKEVKSKPVEETKGELFDEFVEKNIRRKFFTNKELKKIAKSDEYYKFICGSDQVWCSTTTYVDPLMYLRFAPERKRVAYAPSIGRDFIPSYNRRQMKKYVNGIPFVSIRENDGQRLIKELTGRDVPVVLDPTLLISAREWKELSNGSFSVEKQYLLVYFLDVPSKENSEKIIDFAEKNGLKIVSIGCKLDLERDCGMISRPDCGPAEFLTLIENAENIITDSYHGMLFAINYGKKFWSLKREYKQYDQSSRQLTILENLGIEERYIEDASRMNSSDINYTEVSEKLDILRKESIEYLHNSINGQET